MPIMTSLWSCPLKAARVCAHARMAALHAHAHSANILWSQTISFWVCFGQFSVYLVLSSGPCTRQQYPDASAMDNNHTQVSSKKQWTNFLLKFEFLLLLVTSLSELLHVHICFLTLQLQVSLHITYYMCIYKITPSVLATQLGGKIHPRAKHCRIMQNDKWHDYMHSITL